MKSKRIIVFILCIITLVYTTIIPLNALSVISPRANNVQCMGCGAIGYIREFQCWEGMGGTADVRTATCTTHSNCTKTTYAFYLVGRLCYYCGSPYVGTSAPHNCEVYHSSTGQYESICTHPKN